MNVSLIINYFLLHKVFFSPTGALFQESLEPKMLVIKQKNGTSIAATAFKWSACWYSCFRGKNYFVMLCFQTT